jgi:hypothetical protein
MAHCDKCPLAMKRSRPDWHALWSAEMDEGTLAGMITRLGTVGRRAATVAMGLAIPFGTTGCTVPFLLHAATSGSSTTNAPPSSVAAPSSTPSSQSLRDWVRNADPTMRRIIAAADGVNTALHSGDVAGLNPACQKMQDAVQKFQDLMPTPDTRLNPVLQESINDWNSGTHFCIAGAEDQDINEITRGVDLVNNGIHNLDAAVAIAKQDMG